MSREEKLMDEGDEDLEIRLLEEYDELMRERVVGQVVRHF